MFTNGTDSTASLRTDWPWLIKTAEIGVETTKLDDLIEQYGRPTYCKIDVEGSELLVLLGLSQPLSYISFEYHVSEPERAEDCLRVLSRLGRFQVNMTTMDAENWSGDWMMREWLSSGECLARLSCGTLLKQEEYADIFVSYGIS